MVDLKTIKSFLPYLIFLTFFIIVVYRVVIYGTTSEKPKTKKDRVKFELNKYVRMKSKLSGNIHPIDGLLRKEYKRKLCELDLTSIRKLKTFNASVNNHGIVWRKYVNDFFHEFIQNPHQSFCKEMKRFGGQFNTNCKYTDGSKFVCMDELIKDIQNGECLIYSFGIAEDWSFEDIMDDLGCEVHAFDGSVNYPDRRGNRIRFKKIMIGIEDIERNNISTRTLTNIMAQNGHTHTKISYLKMDIEGNELIGLPIWLRKGALSNVDQIGLEFHLDTNIMKTLRFIETLKELYFKGGYRLISYDANGCAKNVETKKGIIQYFNLAEIVLKKVDIKYNCI